MAISTFRINSAIGVMLFPPIAVACFCLPPLSPTSKGNGAREAAQVKQWGLFAVSDRNLNQGERAALTGDPTQPMGLQKLGWKQKEVDGFTFWTQPDLMGFAWRKRALDVALKLSQLSKVLGQRVRFADLPDPLGEQARSIAARAVIPGDTRFHEGLFASPDLGGALGLEQTFTLTDGERTIKLRMPMGPVNWQESQQAVPLQAPTKSLKPDLPQAITSLQFHLTSAASALRPEEVLEHTASVQRLLLEEARKEAQDLEAKKNAVLDSLHQLYAEHIGKPGDPDYLSWASLSPDQQRDFRNNARSRFREFGFASQQEMDQFLRRSSITARDSDRVIMRIVVQRSGPNGSERASRIVPLEP